MTIQEIQKTQACLSRLITISNLLEEELEFDDIIELYIALEKLDMAIAQLRKTVKAHALVVVSKTETF
jgi:hypothetical protein